MNRQRRQGRYGTGRAAPTPLTRREHDERIATAAADIFLERHTTADFANRTPSGAMGIIDGWQADDTIAFERKLAAYRQYSARKKKKASYRVYDGQVKRAQSFFKYDLTSVGETGGHCDSDW